MMGLTLSPEQEQIRDSVQRLCDQFDDSYWYNKDLSHEYPTEFRDAMAAAGWLGIAMPQEFGGAGLGITEASMVMRVVAGSGGGMAACATVHINIFAPHCIVVHGTDEQKALFLPPLIDGSDLACFGVTEPDAGLDTTHITTRAVRDGDYYIVNGQKVWTTNAQRGTKILLLTRTTPIEECRKPTDGMTLFYTDIDRDRIEIREIHKLGRGAVDSNSIFIEDLKVPEGHRIGPEGAGFRILLDSLNPERILIAAETIGLGHRALAKASQYAKDRQVFGRPIGQNQAIQHPLADSWMQLEAADLMVGRAARLYDEGLPCGAYANAAKYLGAEACFLACDRAVRTHGGFGYAKEYHVERYFREAVLPRIGPVTREMILSFIAERELGLPKSY